MNATMTVEAPEKQDPAPLILLGAMVLGLIYVYLDTLRATTGYWQLPQYSHGYLIPLFTIFLLWARREPISLDATPAARWTGFGLLAGGLLLRLAAAYPQIVTLDALSIIPCLMGVFLMIGGWKTFKWSWPALAFLVFMFPVPDQVERRLLNPLQHVATEASTFVLQTLGLAAYSQGPVIRLGEFDLGVVDQCAGLRMGMILFALGFAVVMLLRPSWWESLIIIASTVPIAVVANVARIVIQSLLLYYGYPEAAEFFHNRAAAFVVMPIALGLLYLELQILLHLFIDDGPMTPMGFGTPAAAAAPAKAAAPPRAKTASTGPSIPIP